MISNEYTEIIAVYKPFTVSVTTNCVIPVGEFVAPTSPTEWIVYVIGGGNADTTHDFDYWIQGEISDTCCYPETLSIVPDVTDYSWITFDNVRRVTISEGDNAELDSLS